MTRRVTREQERRMAHVQRRPPGRRWALAGVVILALSVACGTPEPRGQFGADSSPVSVQPTYNPLTPTAPVTIADVQQQLSFPLRLPGVLPAGLFLQQAAAWPAEDSATFNYTNA